RRALDDVNRREWPADERRIELLPILLASGQPQVPAEDMREVVMSLFVEQLCEGFPVQPPNIERAVNELHKVVREKTAAAQNVSGSCCLEPSSVRHQLGGDRTHLLVAYHRIEVRLHTPGKCVAVDVNQSVV